MAMTPTSYLFGLELNFAGQFSALHQFTLGTKMAKSQESLQKVRENGLDYE